MLKAEFKKLKNTDSTLLFFYEKKIYALFHLFCKIYPVENYQYNYNIFVLNLCMFYNIYFETARSYSF